MTSNVYKSTHLTNSLNSHSVNIIHKAEQEVTKHLISSCNLDDIFINSVWLDLDDNLKKLSSVEHKRTFVYSGFDWENTNCRPEPNTFIKENFNNVKYIGNYDGDMYFNFWLTFLNPYLGNFHMPSIDTSITKLFMNLNRKPHNHRIELFEKLKDSNLIESGYVSMGEYAGNPPYLLQQDIINIEGDEAHGGDPLPITNDITSLGNKEYWDKHLINIVSETTVHSNFFISEKTWKPILGGKLFMILGDHGIYSKLKEYGVDTFDDIFGTGYKNTNTSERINWITGNLLKYRDSNYTQLYKKLYPRLVKNREIAIKLVVNNKLKLQDLQTKIRGNKNLI